jgi:hypothetical protein
MCNWSRKGFYAFGVFLGAGLTLGAGAAGATTLSGIGTSEPRVQTDVLSVGYHGHRYYYYDFAGPAAYRWANAYYSALMHHKPPPPDPASYYVRDYYYDVLPEYVWVSAPRPRSCGVYHYWNGYCCVDARHYPPYVGPRW